MTRLTWIDTVQDDTWLPGLRAAVLLLRAGQKVYLNPDASEGEPYLAVADVPDEAIACVGADLRVRPGGWQRVLHPGAGGHGGPPLHELRAPAVAVFGGAGSPYNHAAAVAALGFPWSYVAGSEIAAGALAHADVLVVPGGGWRFGSGQLADMGEAGVEAARRFVEEGGGYLASCAGSTIAMRVPDAALSAWHPTKADFTLLDVENWERLRDGEGGHRSPGIGTVATRIATPRHPVALGLPARIEMTHYNGPIFAEPPDGIEAVVRYDGPTDGFTPSECFHGHPDRPSSADRAGSLMADAGRLSLAGVVAGERGQGRVVLAGLHPEFGLGPALADWGRPVQVIGNALLWQAQFGRGLPPSFPVAESDVVKAQSTLERSLDQARSAARRLVEADRRIGRDWLNGPVPRAAFGLSAVELWDQALADLPAAIDRIWAAWVSARPGTAQSGDGRLAAAVLHRYEPDGGADLGAQGVVWLVDEATRLIDEAVAAGDGAEKLVSRSYLSAIGLLANAKQRLDAEAATCAAEDDLARLKQILATATAGAAV